MTLEEVKELVCEFGSEDAVVFDDFCDAFIGVTEDGRAAYDYEKMVQCLVDEDGMTEEDAMDYIAYNTIMAIPYMGDMAPVVIYPLNYEWL